MEIDKAIELLIDLQHQFHISPYPDTNQAILLGIQALKRHSNREQNTFSGLLQPLPGETVETDSP